jgi:primary-amine oxidase
MLATNSYLSSVWRDALPPLDVVQPEGASFAVDGKEITWDKWSLRIGFNYREGLVLHNVKYDGRPVLHRASLVEMAVPYGDPNPPYQRKCAFDVGDYGLGYCTDSLELGCDCLGNIHYFDATLADSKGEPYEIKKAVCLHEEDHGLLWKHVEFRTGHSEARRSRRLVLSFICTVVNYEYLFYWYLLQDGTIEYEIKLTGMLSTSLPSAGTRSTLVAPGVNAQVHQHMFCARLDMAVDGMVNSVEEVDVVYAPSGDGGPYDNVFGPVATHLTTEKQAVRSANQNTARAWKISNPESLNPITGEPVGYKLVPFTRGAAMPNLLTGPNSAVTKKGEFATKNLWVTPYADDEKWPAGEFTIQGASGEGLPTYIAADRDVSKGDLVLWHSFGVVHVPRPEDFPVMPVEHTGFSLKPEGFFSGNPAIDLPPPADHGKSTCCSDAK